MSLLRGIQSAIFYYVSCSPYFEHRYQKSRKKQAQRSKKERDQMRLEQPDMMHQPVPFEQNPHWQADIVLGPHRIPRRQRNKTRDTAGSNQQSGTVSQMQLVSQDDDSANEQRGDPRKGYSGRKRRQRGTTVDSTSSAPRYQREDEEWDEHEQLPVRVVSRGASRTGSRPGTSSSTASYYVSRCPPVNDLHPPVVSTLPTNPADTRWMTHRPPSARFMEGKGKRPPTGSRSRSSSGASMQRGGSSPGKQVAQRAVDGMSSRGATPVAMSRSSSGQGSISREPTNRSAGSSYRRKKRRPPPIRTGSDSSGDSSDTVISLPIKKPEPAHFSTANGKMRPKISHTKLATIMSSRDYSPPRDPQRSLNISPPSSPTIAPATVSEYDFANKDGKPAKRPTIIASSVEKPKRPPLIVADSSLNVLQNLVSASSLRNSRSFNSPTLEAKKTKLPADAPDDDIMSVDSDDFWYLDDSDNRGFSVERLDLHRRSMDDYILLSSSLGLRH